MICCFGHKFGSNGPLWSLGYEVVYYLLYPAWLAVRLAKGFVAAYILAAVPFLLGWLVLPAYFLGAVLMHYPLWLAGAGLAEAFGNPRVSRWLTWRSSAILGAVAIGLFALNQSVPGVIVPYICGGVAIVLFFARVPERWNCRPWHQLWEQLGIGFYTIYVCHFL